MVPYTTTQNETVATGPNASDDHPTLQATNAPGLPVKQPLMAELKRRNVARIALLYLLTCWLMLELAHASFLRPGLPTWASRLVVALMVVGFLAVVIGAWVFGNNAAGRPTTAAAVSAESLPGPPSQRLNRAIAVALVLALGTILADRLWRVQHPESERLVATTGDGAAPQTRSTASRSIAVLPFRDVSEKHDQEYFSDGLSEELIARLAQSSGLQVIARASSFAFKGKLEDVAAIAKQLNVGHVLTGSAHKTANRLTITAALVRTDTGARDWSETYERDLRDVFKVQADIAQAVARRLDATRVAASAHAEAAPRNLEAYELMLKGRFFAVRNTKADSEAALRYFREALKRDPTYARAWTELASLCTQRADNSWVSTEEGYGLARDAVAKALELDPQLAAAYVVLSKIQSTYDFDFATAEASLQRARTLNPGEPNVFVIGAVLATSLGRFDEAMTLARAAIERNPLDAWVMSRLMKVLWYTNRLPEAEATGRKLLELDPGFEEGHYLVGLVLLSRGQYPAALAEIQQEPEETWRLAGLPLAFDALGRRAESDAALAELTRKYAGDTAYQIAAVYAQRLEIDQAFYWLDRAYAQRDGGLSDAKFDPQLAPLRRDRRYGALLRQLRLAD